MVSGNWSVCALDITRNANLEEQISEAGFAPGKT
jgi:hypothetical protein